MSKPEDIPQDVWDKSRDALADTLGIHPDFLEDNDVDVKTMCFHFGEAMEGVRLELSKEIERLEADTERLLNAVNACDLTPEQKHFIADHLERSRPSHS